MYVDAKYVRSNMSVMPIFYVVTKRRVSQEDRKFRAGNDRFRTTRGTIATAENAGLLLEQLITRYRKAVFQARGNYRQILLISRHVLLPTDDISVLLRVFPVPKNSIWKHGRVSAARLKFTALMAFAQTCVFLVAIVHRYRRAPARAFSQRVRIQK